MFKLFDSDKKSEMKTLQTDTNNLVVKIIEDKTEQLTVALGITEENADRLHKIAEKAIRSTETISGAMEVISKECKHANELMWIGFVMGRNMGERSSRSSKGNARVISMKGSEIPEEMREFLDDLMKRHGKDNDSEEEDDDEKKKK